jgi:hypothetical protein
MKVSGQRALKWLRQNGATQSELKFFRQQMSCGANLEIETMDSLPDDVVHAELISLGASTDLLGPESAGPSTNQPNSVALPDASIGETHNEQKH